MCMEKGMNIHIVVASDDAYVQHLGVLLVSIFENNKQEFIEIHLLSDSIAAENLSLLSSIVEKQYAGRLHVYEMDRNIFKDFPVRASDHISIAAYYRLNLADLLPNNLSRILYMDCDMVVTGMLRPLWDTDLTGVAVAAVEDIMTYTENPFGRLNIPPGNGYFNSGLLLINLDCWREADVFKRAMQIVEEKSGLLLWHDQDILNILFSSSWKRLPFRWNVMNTLMRPFPFFTGKLLLEIDDEIRHRVVVHYTCAWKPWIYPCNNPLRFEYYKYLQLSPWKGFTPHKPIIRRVKEGINQFRVAMGLLKKGYREGDWLCL